MKLVLKPFSAEEYALEKNLMQHYAGELPQSDFKHSTHLKWVNADNEDNLQSPAQAYSKALDVYWYIDLDQDMRFVLYLNNMRVGTGNYSFKSTAKELAECCEHAIRKDITAYIRMLEIVELSKAVG